MIHRAELGADSGSDGWRVSLLDCLLQIARTEQPQETVAALDSALRYGLLTSLQVEWLDSQLPARCGAVIEFADARSESYPESVIRWLLACAAIPHQIQVPVLGERWIDILIGDRLALEIDGADKYSRDATPEEVAKRVNSDRQRDAFLEALGYHVVRLSYVMIMFDWPATLTMIQAVIERGDHLARTKSMRAGS